MRRLPQGVALPEESHSLLDAVHREIGICHWTAVGTGDDPHLVMLEHELAQPLYLRLDVLQAGPVQGVLQEDTGELRDRQVGDLFGKLAAMLLAVVMPKAQSVGGEQDPLGFVEACTASELDTRASSCGWCPWWS